MWCISPDEVGENLQDHLQLRVAFRVENVATLNQRAEVPYWGALV